MGWWIFFSISCLTAALIVPFKKWINLFAIGLISMVIILFVDGSLVHLGAFQFNFKGLKIYGLPLPYWLSYIPGGILFGYIRPAARLPRLFFILAIALFYALVELITIKLGLFQHLNWSILKASILNIGCFTVLLWFTEWLNSMIKIKGKFA